MSKNEVRNFSSEEDVDRYFLTVSHELKAPLTEIAAYAKIVEEDCREILPDQARDDLNSIRRICDSTLTLIQVYVEYSRSQFSKLELEKINLREMIEESFRQLTDPFREREIRLILPEKVPDLIADRMLCMQLINNILANSIKFTTSRKNAQIRLRYVRNEKMTQFCFEDNGEGVSEEFAKRAFDLFEKSDEESNAGGSGIGLNLVKRIVERFRGNVSISSVQGESFSIRVDLPNEMVVMPLSREGDENSRELRIGVIGALSGDYSGIAPCRRFAYELAVEEINRTGGILGRKVRLLFRDFHSDLSAVPSIAWELAAVDRVDVLMGGQLSSAREYVRDVAHKMKIPYFFSALYEGGLADHYTFCISNTPEQNVYPMIDQMLPVYGRKCYIIAADYNYGVLSAECTRHYIENSGASVVGIEYFTPTKPDFKDSIEKINDADPDILLSFCVGNNQECFHEQWYRFKKRDIPLISTIGIGLSSLHRTLPPPVMANTFFMSSYIEELDTPEALSFSAKIRKRHPKSEAPYIEFDAETAYTAVYLYKKAVEAAGSTNTEDVISALESGRITFHGPGGQVTVQGEDHHVIRDVTMFRVDSQHKIKKEMYFPGLKTNFVEEALKEDCKRDTNLRDLGTDAPNIQYNVLYNRIVQ